ncbi:MAG: hypothetical protein F6K47_36720, partial [Symploca sp. SIO2E6]|nr:hypothetical protein [Symploca sp. SIO2E6]
SVTGSVRHPGEYPLDDDMHLSDLIRAAGGLTEEAYTLQGELLRYTDNGKTLRDSILLAVQLGSTQGEGIPLQSFDELNVKRIPEWHEIRKVILEGDVRFPGEYTIERGETLSEVLVRAGGLTQLGHAPSALFLRESLRDQEAENIEKLRERLRSELAAIAFQKEVFTSDSSATIESLLSQLENTEAVGRLVIDLPAILEGVTDITLKDGDQLIIPPKPQSVTVIGSVNYPTSHLFDASLNRNQYIALSGGFTRNADKRQVYIVRANGQVDIEEHSRFFPRGGVIVAPGDTIVVPVNVNKIPSLKLWTVTSQIFYQIALGAAAVNSF